MYLFSVALLFIMYKSYLFSVQAQDFEYDNLYITYFLELPQCKD